MIAAPCGHLVTSHNDDNFAKSQTLEFYFSFLVNWYIEIVKIKDKNLNI